MDTSALKRFATQARIKLKEGVSNKLRELGFDEDGKTVSQPRLVRGGTLYNNACYEESFYHQWWALYRAIQTHGVQGVLEEAAYTWFNRFMAIRILQKNGFIQPVLSFDNPDIRVPHIVSEARQGRYPAMDVEERMRLLAVIGDATKTYEQFALLVIAFCHHTPIISRCFGLLTDYTELLLPRDVLHREGFLDMLNHTKFIADEDYTTTELLGWLY
ncbi:MAG: BREX-1 system adenine-specific DNA-methyltransferase PglX, partial [Prevotellaceae bacterium]|nr:BREX-1 system adenine-specific DNA-methyltransferase PglX [Prevotellaceae bacterium]